MPMLGSRKGNIWRTYHVSNNGVSWCILASSFTFNCFFGCMKVGLAEKTAVLFTKDGDQHNNLHDMQCMWYVLFALSYPSLMFTFYLIT